MISDLIHFLFVISILIIFINLKLEKSLKWILSFFIIKFKIYK
jgi:hypothetical protein